MTTLTTDVEARDASGGSDTIRALRVWQAEMAIAATYLFFEVETEQGRVGVGEATVRKEFQSVADRANRLFTELAKGKSLAAIPVIIDQSLRATGANPTQHEAAALSGFEQALQDLRGQALGLPVYELLGGRAHETLPLYANVNRSTFGGDRGPEGIARSARAAVDAGFTNVKIAPFDGVHPDSTPDSPKVRLGIERILAVHKEVGPEVGIFVNCHERLNPEITDAILPELTENGVVWFQSPYPTKAVNPHADATLEDPPASGNAPDKTYPAVSPIEYQELARRSPILLAGGAPYGLQGHKSVLDLGALTYIMTDVIYSGGIGLARSIGDLVGSYGVKFTPHNPWGPIATVAAAHVCTATPAFRILEFQYGEVPTRDLLLTPGEYREGGTITLGNAPGLGVQIDHDGLKTHAKSVERLVG